MPSNRRKREIRAHQATTGQPYSVAARAVDQAAEQPPTGPALRITEITFNPPPVAATWDTPRTYRCRCGQLGGLTGAVERDAHVGYVLDDGSTYLLAYCPDCLPRPVGPWGPEHEQHAAETWEATTALRDVVEVDLAGGARRTDFYRCSVNGHGWHIDARISLPFTPLLDASTDLFVHPCPDCWRERGEQACAEAHRQAAASIARGHWD